jgi:hypothetical protein
MSLVPHAQKLQKEEKGLIAPLFLREEEMDISKEKIITCKWCYQVYHISKESIHKECKQKRSKYLKYLTIRDKQNKYLEKSK